MPRTKQQYTAMTAASSPQTWLVSSFLPTVNTMMPWEPEQTHTRKHMLRQCPCTTLWYIVLDRAVTIFSYKKICVTLCHYYHPVDGNSHTKVTGIFVVKFEKESQGPGAHYPEDPDLFCGRSFKFFFQEVPILGFHVTSSLSKIQKKLPVSILLRFLIWL